MSPFSLFKRSDRSAQSSSQQKGLAIMLAVFTVVLATYIATEVSYESNVEYIVNAQAVSKIKAYYAARSGVELSLFRIKLYQAAQAQYGQMLGNNTKMLDLIWSFPFAWPPPTLPTMTAVDQDQVKDVVKESKMDASYMTSIQEEGSKLDLNDLASPSKSIRESTKKRLMQIFEIRLKNDEKFRHEYEDFKFSGLINRIVDWVSPGKTSVEGGEKSRFYHPDEETGPLPPNRAFRTFGELRLVADMNDEFYRMLESQATIYGTKAINPNYASADILKNLDVSMTNEVVQKIIERRESEQKGGHFVGSKEKGCADEFWSFVNSVGGRVTDEIQQSVPISCDPVYTFKITSTGMYSGVSRQITAIVYDVQRAAAKVGEAIKKDNPPKDAQGNPIKQNPPTNGQGSSSGGQNNTPSKGRPRVVYWIEQ